MENLPIEMRKVYLQRRQQDIEQLRLDLAEKRVSHFNKLGHQLIGNCKNFGFEELLPIAHQMDELTVDRLSTEGPVLIEQYHLLISELELRLNKESEH